MAIFHLNIQTKGWTTDFVSYFTNERLWKMLECILFYTNFSYPDRSVPLFALNRFSGHLDGHKVNQRYVPIHIFSPRGICYFCWKWNENIVLLITFEWCSCWSHQLDIIKWICWSSGIDLERFIGDILLRDEILCNHWINTKASNMFSCWKV